MKTSSLKTLIPPLLACCLMLSSTWAFRPIDRDGKEVIADFEQRFHVNNHLELYRLYQFDSGGTVKQGWMYLAYEYKDEQVRGIWRILEESEDFPPATLLNIQDFGTFGELYLYAPAEGKNGRIRGRDRIGNFNGTDWHLDDIIDFDKADLEFIRDGATVIQGTYATRVTARARSRQSRHDSVYGHTQSYFTAPDNQFVKIDGYDHDGVLLKDIRVADYVNLGDKEKTLLRPWRIEIRDFTDQSTLVCVKIASAYDIDLGDQFFTQKKAREWSAEKDAALKDRLQPVHAPQDS